MDKIVFTSGSFDLLHVGHLNFLEGAKALGDRLIVGVERDDWMKEVKGFSPIMPLRDRLRMVSALKMVDWAVPVFGPADEKDLVRWGVTIRAVGEDHGFWYKSNEVRAKMEAAGIEYVHLPYTKGISSSSLRSKHPTKFYDYFIINSSSLDAHALDAASRLWARGVDTFLPHVDIEGRSISPTEYKRRIINAISRSKKAKMYWDGVSHGPLIDLGICLGLGVEIDEVEIITVSKADAYVRGLC